MQPQAPVSGGMRPEEWEPEPVRVDADTTVEPNVISLPPPEKWRVVRQQCESGKHNLVDDDTEQEFHAKRCTNCNYGILLGRKNSA